MGNNGRLEKQKQERLGEINYTKQGERMTIIEYFSATNITVQFDNGDKVYKATYRSFKEGYNLNASKKSENRLGEVGYNNDGEKMIIVEYYNSDNATVEFGNKLKAFGVKYSNFQNGSVKNPINNPENRIGEVNYNSYGSKMTIIEYINFKNITIEFDNGYIFKKAHYGNFKEGSIVSPYCKTILGVGYLGEGIYKETINGLRTPEYEEWRGMLRRCYDEKFLKKRPTYKGCTVAEEWHNFQNFAQFYHDNYYKIERQQTHLDKDILYKNNKIYSKETCIFCPERINVLFIKNDVNRGRTPIGASLHQEINKYQARCKDGTRNGVYLGLYNTSEEAFQAYKKYKEKLIKQIADEYKDRIPERLYQSMMLYQVEITD